MATHDEVTGKANGISSAEFVLLPAVPEDAEAIQRLAMRANKNNTTHSRIYPKDRAHLTSPEELFQFRLNRLRKSMHDDDMLHFKMTLKDAPNNVIGHAAWYKPGHFKANHTLSKQLNKPEEDFPPSMDVNVHKTFTAKLDEQRKAIWGEDANYWYLAALSVDPSYQRRRVGTTLVKWGLDRADAENLPTYLEATPEGALMYPRVGFQKVAELDMFDDGKSITEFHIRPAGGVKK